MKSKLTFAAFALLSLTFITLQVGCKKDPLKSKPVACFATLPDTIARGQVYTFNAGCSEGALSYVWSFGDGGVAATAVATHKYTTNGTYTVTLTVVNTEGQSTITKTVTVKSLACNLGYEGTDCTTESRTKFIGNYSGSEACNSGNDTYGLGITVNATNIDKITISNIYGGGYTVVATVIGNTFNVPLQATNIPTVSISGSGSISGNSLTFNFTITDGSNSATCIYSGTK
jgi:PKD repeat protein